MKLAKVVWRAALAVFAASTLTNRLYFAEVDGPTGLSPSPLIRDGGFQLENRSLAATVAFENVFPDSKHIPTLCSQLLVVAPVATAV
jgi:hypothetical protein